MAKPPDLGDALRFSSREGYRRQPMPSVRDERITLAVETLCDESAIEAAARSLAAVGETVLSPYAQRAAALAVRLTTPRYLWAGLRAAALIAAIEDPRDAAIVLALLWRSAELLDLDSVAEVTAVARVLGRYGKPLTAFVARPSETRTLEAMGYAEVGEGTEFRYECRW